MPATSEVSEMVMAVPAEIWAIKVGEQIEGGQRVYLVPPNDEADDSFMAFMSEAAATAAIKGQEQYYEGCVLEVIRVK